MLRLIDLTAARGVRTLYSSVSLTASDGERIGLTGANGCGKSTLFALILGELAPESGQVEAPPFARIAHVAQDIDATEDSALDYVLAGHAPLMAARAALLAAESADDHDALAHAHANLAELNEGALAAQAGSVLSGLGFAQSDLSRAVSEFSGGWRNRLALARALLQPADLLLLDEPTNHLDLDSVIWLEAWLKKQPATVLLISHDREFLDRCTTDTWHIAENRIRRYAGNYSAFELAWAEQVRQQDAAAKAYARAAAHLQSFVDRFRAKATKARQAQSRIKMLERLVAVEPARASREWRFEFLEPRKLPERLLDTEALRLTYGKRTILDEVRFLIRSGDRIGILGVNGAGKSTLVKSIAGELVPAAGELRRGAGLAIGYFAQHQLDQLRPDESPLQHLRRLAGETDPQARDQDLRSFLGAFWFGAELAASPIGPMSGGEKARCALALLAWMRPNLLLLDEPTNHLDMQAREALTVALSSFGGALIIVSHDRHLLRATTDQLWLVHDGLVTPFDGDLDEYAALVLASRRVAREADGRGESEAVSRRDERREAARERQRLTSARRPVQQKLAKLEEEIARLTDELRELDARLALPDFYHGDGEIVAEALRNRGALAHRLEALEARWLQLQEQLEAIE